ncbi:hypothetical protein EHN07_05220 [Buttiauxella warmboldiae]|uniref:Type II secretion system protein M n=1 Tax=Buttiauxella warmboldiae TaxID=82993 RepID=A0A3N5DVF9_9ENTR|nr:type II secretion system protein GspM [Buttiauxella warmboldiae]RPH29610.1 hypothetical protein EHN07_05220 [Buttiauxella warmboldiae]
MISRLKRLTTREKYLLLCAMILLTLTLGYQFYWLPVQQWGAREQMLHQRNIIMQQKMQLHAQQQRFTRVTLLQGDLRAQLMEEARRQNIKPEELHPDSNKVRFQLTTLPAPALWKWLDSLQNQQGIEILAITLRHDEHGVSVPDIEVGPRKKEIP